MSTSGLKSSKMHPYQRFCYPFWRRDDNKNAYSDLTKEKFERHKLEFDLEMKYIQWIQKG